MKHESFLHSVQPVPKIDLTFVFRVPAPSISILLSHNSSSNNWLSFSEVDVVLAPLNDACAEYITHYLIETGSPAALLTSSGLRERNNLQGDHLGGRGKNSAVCRAAEPERT